MCALAFPWHTRYIVSVVRHGSLEPSREMASEMEKSCDREKGKEKEREREREEASHIYVLATLKRVAHGA